MDSAAATRTREAHVKDANRVSGARTIISEQELVSGETAGLLHLTKNMEQKNLAKQIK